ncbi:MAG: alpha-amylase [Chloroflexi bacterium]|nr:alpha-amylase [Chloroflexota bacterium]
MKKIKRGSFLAVCWLVTLLALGACGDSTATTTASATSVPATTAPATTAAFTTAAATTAPATTPATTAAAATTAAPTTQAATTAAATTSAATTQAQPLNIPWVKNGTCYEVFVRSFFDSNGDGNGDLNGLIAKLDYINDGNPNSTKSLGANCIWLMPITSSPSYHGYDTTDYYTINKDYGTNDDFKKFVSEAHKRGIKVLTDLVLNHTSKDHPWFQQASADPNSPYRNYYIFQPNNPGYDNLNGGKAFYKNPKGNDYYFAQFGGDLPDLNWRNPAVVTEMEKVIKYWLSDMDVDGFRLDAVRYLIEDGQNQADTPETKALLRDLSKYIKSVKPDAFTIGEVYTNLPIDSYYPDQLDEYFAFNLADQMVKSGASGTTGFIDTAKTLYNSLPYQRYGVFLTNHDQNRILDAPGISLPKMQVLATSYLTLPGLPFVYYGEEIGMLGRKPDEKIRTPMQWTDDKSGFTTGTPWEDLNTGITQYNVAYQDGKPDSLLNLYRKLIHLRSNTPALAGGTYTPFESTNFIAGAYIRHAENSNIMVVINMDTSDATAIKFSMKSSDLPPGEYKATVLVDINNTNVTFPNLTVGANGAVSGYTPMATIPAGSAYVLELKKAS